MGFGEPSAAPGQSRFDAGEDWRVLKSHGKGRVGIGSEKTVTILPAACPEDTLKRPRVPSGAATTSPTACRSPRDDPAATC